MGRTKNPMFSNDIYYDLHISDLKGEYVKTKNDLDDYNSLIGNKAKALYLEDSAHARHVTNALKEKMQFMKDRLAADLAQADKKITNDTLENFTTLFGLKKNNVDHRMAGLYSYDIKDNNTFRKC